MKLTFSDRFAFIKFSISQHLGLLGIWLAFTLVGSLFFFIGIKSTDGLGFIIFGGLFILLCSAFMLFTLPSSFIHYYQQALTRKYGSYTTATITNKRVDDYSYRTSSLNGSSSKRIEQFTYTIEFEFMYNQHTYENECYFEHKSTFDAIGLTTDLPIKFLKTNPKKVTLRRRKLANDLGLKETMCN